MAGSGLACPAGVALAMRVAVQNSRAVACAAVPMVWMMAWVAGVPPVTVLVTGLVTVLVAGLVTVLVAGLVAAPAAPPDTVT